MSAMLPSVAPLAVAQGIADLIVANSFTTISRQQVSPLGITVGISFGAGDSAQCAGSVSILLLVQDIAAGIIGPCPGLPRRLIILPDELTAGIIGVPGGLSSRRDGLNIAAAAIGVLIVSAVITG